jgi:hypothetical protein
MLLLYHGDIMYFNFLPKSSHLLFEPVTDNLVRKYVYHYIVHYVYFSIYLLLICNLIIIKVSH